MQANLESHVLCKEQYQEFQQAGLELEAPFTYLLLQSAMSEGDAMPAVNVIPSKNVCLTLVKSSGHTCLSKELDMQARGLPTRSAEPM